MNAELDHWKKFYNSHGIEKHLPGGEGYRSVKVL